MMLKVKLSLIFLLLAAGSLSGAIRASVQPREVFVGEAALYTLVSDKAMPEQVKLPDIDGLVWLGGPRTNVKTSWVDGKKSYHASASYTFRIDREQVVKISGVVARENGKRVVVPPIEVMAKQRRFQGNGGKQLTMKDLLWVETEFPGISTGTGAGKAFLGQEIPVEIRVFAVEQFRPDFKYPELAVENAVVRDYSAVNNASSQFAPGATSVEIRQGMRFHVATFTSAITPLNKGVLKVKGSIPVTISLNDRRRDFMEDFMSFRRGGQTRVLSFELPALDVLPPPDLPPDAGQYLGLVGDWAVNFHVSAARVKVGEPLTVTLALAGEGGIGGFRVPALDLPNYRIYEPEIKTEEAAGKITVTWAVIPLSREAPPLSLDISTLKPEKGGEYVTKTFSRPVDILPGDPKQQTGAAVFVPAGTDTQGSTSSTSQPSSLLYIKNRPGNGLPLPLIRNTAAAALGLSVAGLLFFAGCISIRWLRGAQKDETLQRRERAIKNRRKVMRRLAGLEGPSALETAREQVVPWLADVWQCPRGTSATELADLAEKKAPELAEDLRAIDVDGFAPGAVKASFDQKRLAANLKKALCLLLLTVLLPLHARTPATGEEAFPEAVAAYDQGNYEKAEKMFAELQRIDREDPVLLYNRANCLFEMGRPAPALALYERALKLAPRDSDIRENLNFVRAELGLPVTGRAQTPTELLVRIRDSFRPDEWLLMAGVCFFIGNLLAGLVLLRRKRFAILWLFGFVGALALAAVSQNQRLTSYRMGTQAIVTSHQAQAFHNPSQEARKADFHPVYGEKVRIVERRTNWSRVRLGNGEAWMQDEYLEEIW